MIKDIYAVELRTYDELLCYKALDELLNNNNLLDFVKKGMKIGVKLNLVAAMKPEKAATINPMLVKALVKLLISKGAIVTLGDSPGGLFTESALKSVYTQTGIDKLTEVGAILNYNCNQQIVETNGLVVKSLDTTSWLLEQDAIINFSKIKSHGMMGLSGAVKNLFGTVPGILKPEYHYRYSEHSDFADMLIDINEFYKPILNIMDCVVGMEGNGPTQDTPRDIGLVMASKNQYALDIAACYLINLDVNNVRTVSESIRLGFTPDNIKDLNINIDLSKYQVLDFKKIEPGKNMKFNGYGIFSSLVEKILVVKPICKTKSCIGCKKCFNICPAKAISMVNNYPVIDRNKCIRCFCCQEFCPVGAMQTKKNPLVKLLTKGK